MKKFIRTSALGVGATVAVLMGASAAHAAGTYVSVGGSTAPGTVAYSATNSTDIVFNTNFGTKLTCTSASISGDLYRGVEVTPSNGIGAIVASGACSMGILGLTFTMSGDMVVRNDPPSAGADVDVTLTDVHAEFGATPGGTCTFDADGTLDAVLKAGSGGRDATLELVSATFAPGTGFGLTISNVVGCGGEWLNGDLMGAWDSDKTVGTPSTFEIDTSGVVTHS